MPFVQQDERLARSSSGPFCLRDPRVASMLQQALRYGETPHNLYFLHTWVSMPNHVHVILEPRPALPEIMRWLKGRTGRKATQILGRRGRAFWQDESCDQWVRTTEELHELMPEADHELRWSAPLVPKADHELRWSAPPR